MEIDLAGYSGCTFSLCDKKEILTKFSAYKDVSNDLELCTKKQDSLARSRSLYPLKVLRSIGTKRIGDHFSVSMRYIPEKDLNSFDVIPCFARHDILKYLSHEKIIRNDLNSVIKQRLFSIRDTPLKDIVINSLNSVPNSYPFASCHGDFGLKNLIYYNGSVYTFDVRNSFIQSRLHDVATLWLSIVDSENKSKSALLKDAMSIYSGFKEQIKLIRRVRILEFYNPAHNNDKVNKAHEKWFCAE